jgi:hypothetical protein
MINGLFGTDYPEDSTITYNWTEFHDESLKKTLADTILTINGSNSYHMEAQITEDEDIIFRMFSYGFHHADINRYIENGEYFLPFPEPKIIYFCTTKNVPPELTLKILFGDNETYEYKVPTFNYLATTPEELNDKKMVILIPFQLLRLKDVMKQKTGRTEENKEKLKYIIEHDIIQSIDVNLKAGNITVSDARRLRRLTHRLYQHIYAYQEELKEITEMTDESLMLDIDIIEKEHEERLAKMDNELAEKNKELAEKDNALAEKDNEIELLKQQIAALKKSE